MEKKKYIVPSMEEIEVEAFDLLYISGDDGLGYGGESDGSEDPQ